MHSAPVSCQYSFEDLLALLHGHAPAKVTRSRTIVVALRMAICQWDSKSTASTTVNSPLSWMVLAERKKFSR